MLTDQSTETRAAAGAPRSPDAKFGVTVANEAAFSMDTVAPFRHNFDRQEPGTFLMNGFIFISAPPSVTPFHIDREHNFWMQIRGRKTMNVWNADDRMMVSQQDVERFITYCSLENVKLRDAKLTGRSLELDCGPGDGIYFPSTAPHATRCDPAWTTPVDDVAISIGINFYTPVTRQRANIHALNEMLRKLGLNPTFPGQSPALDSVKYPIAKACLAVQKMRGFEAPPGF